MIDKINSLAELRPGDIMLGPIGGFVPGVFPVGAGQLLLGEAFRIGALSIRHAGVVVQAAQTVFIKGFDTGGSRLVQAMPHGAEEIEMRTATHWTPRHAYVRLSEDYPGQASDAAAIARLMVAEKVPYSFLSYAALAAWKFGVGTPRLEKWIDRRMPHIEVPYRIGPPQPLGVHVLSTHVALPAEAICSVLADQSWSLTGRKVMQGVPHQCVTPGALARRLWMMAVNGEAQWISPM